MITLDKLFIKYANSSEKWILPLPVIENGQLKLRCYMTDRKSFTNTFQNCYTYLVDFNTLADFFAYKSNGQAYNELIKNKKVRTGFLKESDHEKGNFLMSDIIEVANNGRSKLVLEAISTIMNVQYKYFTMEAISEIEKAQREKEKKELIKLEKELMEMGYNY